LGGLYFTGKRHFTAKKQKAFLPLQKINCRSANADINCRSPGGELTSRLPLRKGAFKNLTQGRKEHKVRRAKKAY
jgi:hypothetical protein